jgi:CRISPR-associated protein Csa1
MLNRRATSVFLLTYEERQSLTRGLLPMVRQTDICDDLRGWNWNRPPVASTTDIQLGAWEIGSLYCDTSRDVYLRRVINVKYSPTAAMKRGRIFHTLFVGLVTAVKKMIYSKGITCLNEIENDLMMPSETAIKSCGPVGGDNLSMQAVTFWRYLHRRLVVALQEALTSQPRHSEDSLVAAVLPLITEWKIDGRRVGLSPHLSVDALTLGAPVLIKMTVDQPQFGHRLQIAAYALAAESVYEVPFELGCMSYLTVDGTHCSLNNDLFIIDEGLREDMLDARDAKLALLESKIQPPVSQACSKACPYLGYCHRDSMTPSKPAEMSLQPAMPASLDASDLEVWAPAPSQMPEGAEQVEDLRR